ncbi:MAG: hypothetical protein ACRDJV_04615 [Actinomycetota bacterium]
MPVAVKEKKPESVGVLTEEDIALLVDAERALEAGGDGHDGGEFLGRGGDRPSPQKEWPLVPAVIVVTLIGVLLTFLGMLTQMWANMAGAQLPGS